ncbi:amino acid ABC transporter permease [Marinobacter nanhaiticus D15-8W]|uniref:Amino acid ABC transporter permease n=1 Tax=Marinobacter nanhaiticus D15-8W TaxID=626887 RepID=N6WXX4_9GAMM|nr:amino acid ABC transporter permease [Marinobacter nanhaiticus]ENO15942.1 amino acid ABC transporter permease [Marinobacter nanhaiticus D15-8W]BES73200.1 amino acid ABC transporter permease [Marinobacter nanhaiticus D15-8W]
MSEWDILWDSRDVFVDGFFNTLILFGVSAGLGFLLGCVIVYCLEWAKAPLRIPLRIFIDGMRLLPFLILAYLFYYGLPSLGLRLSSWQAGVSALVLYHGAYFAEILRGTRITLPPGQVEAAVAQGFSMPTMFLRLILPQLVMKSRGVLGNQLIILLKDTAFLVIITVRELTAAANGLSGTYFIPMEAFIVAIGFYWLISIALEQAVNLMGRTSEKRGFKNA